MKKYEAPTVMELGSVAEFTRADGIGWHHDNSAWLSPWGLDFGWAPGGGGAPTS